MKLTETIIRDLDFGEECWIKGEFKAGVMDIPPEVVLGGRNMEIIDAEKAVVVEKVNIPQCVADWVEQKKPNGDLEKLLDISTYCDDEKVLNWYDNFANDNLAEEILAKAYLVGYVVEEPLGVLLVDLPVDASYSYLRYGNSYLIEYTDTIKTINLRAIKITEAEAKEKYPNFKWVSLEELENED